MQYKTLPLNPLYNYGHNRRITIDGSIVEIGRGYVLAFNNTGPAIGSYADANRIAHRALYNSGRHANIDVLYGFHAEIDGIINVDEIVGLPRSNNDCTYSVIFSNSIYAIIDKPLASNNASLWPGIDNTGQIAGIYLDTIAGSDDSQYPLVAIRVGAYALSAPKFFGEFNAGTGDWTGQDPYLAALPDLNRDAMAEISGFGSAGTHVPLATDGGSFSASAPTSYYVATNGNDAWSGTLEAPNASNTDGPFRTLNKAKTAMESSTTKTTTVRGGTYSIVSSLNFDYYASDNGETWISYRGETPIIDGGGTGYITGNAPNFTMEGFTFQHMGSSPDGQTLHWDGNAGTFRWNTFLNSVHSAFGGTTSNTIFDSNTINGAGNGGFHGALVFWYGASNNQITHNLIENSAEAGVLFGNTPGNPPISNNIVDRNIFRNTCTNTTDIGAFYIYDTAQTGTGNQFTNNGVFDVGGAASSVSYVYLDGSASNVLVSGNIFASTGPATGGEQVMLIHGGKNNIITRNIIQVQGVSPYTDIWGNSAQNGAPYLGFYQSDSEDINRGIPDTGMSGNTFTQNIVFSRSSWPDPLWMVGLNSTDVLPTVSANKYYSATGASISNYGINDSSAFYDDPLFVDPSIATNVDNLFDFSSIDDKILLSEAVVTATGASGTLTSNSFFVGAPPYDAWLGVYSQN